MAKSCVILGCENEIYSVNGYAFGYMHHPIPVETDKQYRIYLVNMLEFDLINSFHVHGTLFEYQPSGIPQGTFVNDIVTLSQGDRGVLELNFPLDGRFMFHAHQTEFTDKGWMGFFEATPPSLSKSNEPTTGMDGHT